jgi:hypothetical protein
VRGADPAVTIKTEPLAVTIEEAAKIVCLSRSEFYREYLDTGRVRPLPKGRKRRRRMIDVKELTIAYEQYKAETRADE